MQLVSSHLRPLRRGHFGPLPSVYTRISDMVVCCDYVPERAVRRISNELYSVARPPSHQPPCALYREFLGCHVPGVRW
jgi:hypothetical protein